MIITEGEMDRRRLNDLLDGQGDELTRIREDRDREYERRLMAEAERDAAYELLRGAHIGVPHKG